MRTIVVRFPPALLIELDRLAKRKGVSRSKLIRNACRLEIAGSRQEASGPGSLPPDGGDLQLLQRDADEMLRAIRAARRSRRGPPFE